MAADVRPGARPDEGLDEVVERGADLYETRLRASLEPEHTGEFVAIHPDTGEFAVGTDEDEVLRRLRSRRPEGLVYLRRIGPPTAADHRLAARLAGRFRSK